MKVSIHGKQFKVSDALKQYVDEHLIRPLTRIHDDQAADLRIEFGEAKLPTGKPGVECHLTLHLPHGRPLQIESQTQDAFASLDDAAERLIRACKKELEKMREPAGRRVEHPLANLPPDGTP